MKSVYTTVETAFTSSGPFPFVPEALANDFREFGSSVSVFADSGVFLGETPSCLWKALFANSQLLLTAPVVQEIEPWLRDSRGVNTRAREIVAEARDCKNTCVRGFVLPERPAFLKDAVEYYANLLGLRKDSMCIFRDELSANADVTPSQQDVVNLATQRIGARGTRLARSGDVFKIRAHRYNDEALVVLATIHALVTGQQTILLTTDADVLEQFYVALWLIDTHFRSMLMAEIYAHNPLAFLPACLARNAPDEIRNWSRRAFSDDETLLMTRPSTHLRELLPPSRTLVPIHCVLIQKEISFLGFGLLREMLDVFRTKAENEWRNTDKLDRRNCHVYLGPLADRIGNWAAIGNDVTVKKDKFSFSIVDVNLAINGQQRFTKMTPTSLIVPGISTF